MKNLYIIRHAKSSWAFPASDDLRPLAKRGINDAHLIGDALSQFDLTPMDVYISSSRRTQETFEILKTYINHKIISENITSNLYTFSEKGFVDFIKNLPNNQNAILIFGHNFALTDFVNNYGSKMIENVATCGFVHLQFEIDNWQDLKRGLTKYKLFPKDLK